MRAYRLAVSRRPNILGFVSSARFQRYLTRTNPSSFAPATRVFVFATVCTVHNTITAISGQPLIQSRRHFAHISASHSPSFRYLRRRHPCKIDRAAIDSFIFRDFCDISATACPIDAPFCVPRPPRPFRDPLEFQLDTPRRSPPIAFSLPLLPFRSHFVCLAALVLFGVCIPSLLLDQWNLQTVKLACPALVRWL